MQAVLVEIAGLRHGAPAQALVRTLTGHEGVHHVTVNDRTDQVTVLYDPDVVTVEELRDAIRRCGLHCVTHVVTASPCLQTSPTAR